MDNLLLQLSACSSLVDEADTGNLTWMDEFSAGFHKFISDFESFLPSIAPNEKLEGNLKIQVEIVFICFTQILTCLTQLERTIKVELRQFGTHLLFARTHFSDRINWCIKRLQHCLAQIKERSEVKLEELTIVELLDQSINNLEAFAEIETEQTVDEKTNNGPEPKDAKKQLNNEVKHIFNHVFAFSDVALKPDQKTINWICQTILDEYSVFNKDFDKHNPAERMEVVLPLQHSLYTLEESLNEALLRLIFTSFHALEVISVNRLKITTPDSDDYEELICGFDVTMDRIQQIGFIAMALTTNAKTKAFVRSSLASLEALDSCLVQAFQEQTSNADIIHANILELHCKEELEVFRNNIHEIIDSEALISCYLDILYRTIPNADILHGNRLLLDIVQMGKVLIQHFELSLNYEELNEDGRRFYEDFVKTLRECLDILQLSSRVDRRRITKRLNILYSALTKLRASFKPCVISRMSCSDSDSEYEDFFCALHSK